MDLSSNDERHLKIIEDNMQRMLSETDGLSYQELKEDEESMSVVKNCHENIGESSRKISKDLKEETEPKVVWSTLETLDSMDDQILSMKRHLVADTSLYTSDSEDIYKASVGKMIDELSKIRKMRLQNLPET